MVYIAINCEFSIAIYNASSTNVDTINISGGTVCAMTAADVRTIGVAIYNNSTGKITISEADPDKPTIITSANATTGAGTIFLANSGTATAVRLSISGGEITNTAASADSRTIYNGGAGTVEISGGTVSANTGRAIHNNAAGALEISGGTVSAETGVAVYNYSTGVITILQGAGLAPVVTSVNTASDSGTIYLRSATGTTTRLSITGGTVQNTATSGSPRAIYNANTDTNSPISITGGTVKYESSNGTDAENGRAIVILGNESVLTIGPGATVTPWSHPWLADSDIGTRPE
jgi:hypothetical protein